MKKIISILFLIIINCIQAEEENKKSNLSYELKLGIIPYSRIGNSYAEGYKFKGIDQGIEVYKNLNGYSIGFGGEVKSKIELKEIPYNDRLYSYYILTKKNIANEYSLIGRLGKISSENYQSNLYGAVGIEKKINRTTFQVLYEKTKLENNTFNKEYEMISFKVGYIFGDNETKIKLKSKKENLKNLAPINTETSKGIEENHKKILEIKDYLLTDNYEAYETVLNEEQKDKINIFIELLENEKGILVLKGYSDNTGKRKLNNELSQKRAEKIKEYLLNSSKFNSSNISISIETIGTVEEFDNSTYEKRKLNRKIEVDFFKEDNL